MRLLKHKHGWGDAVLLVFLLSISVFPAKAAQQDVKEATKTPAPPAAAAAPAPPPSQGIPVEEIAMQATQVGDLIRGFAANLAPSGEIETVRKFLPQVSADIDLELKSTTNILQQQPAFETLQTQQQIWQDKQAQLTVWLSVLTARATKLQVALNQLKKLQETWTRIRDAAKSADVPAPILQQIDATLAAIQAAQSPHEAR